MDIISDGNKNKFYEIPKWVEDLDDLSEYLDLDPYEFNILKTLWIHRGKRHNGTNESREINKRLHYAEKSKQKYLRLQKINTIQNMEKQNENKSIPTIR